MKSWLNNNKNINASDDSLHELERVLGSLPKKSLYIGQRSMMKSSLMRRIKTDRVNLPAGSYQLAGSIRLRGKKVAMPTWAKFVVKERVLDYVETTKNWDTNISYRGKLSWQGYMATFLIVTLTVSLFSVLPVNPKTVMAKAATLDNVSGPVFVQRNNVLLRGLDDLELHKGDKVLTKSDGYATIKFFNNSVTRLNSNTDVNLVLVDREYVNPLVSKIELYLSEGRMWATVINLSDKSSFEVKTEDLSAGIEKKAAFDVEIKDNKTQVAVFNNVVKVKSNNVNSSSKTIISGYQALADDQDTEDIKVEKMQDKHQLIESSQWVAANLSSDDQYKNELIENKEEEVLETSDGDGVEDDTTVVAVIKNEKAEELRQRFIDLQKSLNMGQAQLVRGNRDDGISRLKGYKSEMAHIREDANQYLSDDTASLDALYEYMNSVIDEQISDLSATLPGDRLYRAKEYLQEIEVNLARNDMEKVEIQLSQAGDILLEMEDLINEDKSNLVSTLLKRYQNRTDEFVVAISDDSLNLLDSKKASLLEKQVAQVKVLTAIQRSLNDNGLDDLSDRVELMRGEMLRKFVHALDSYPGEIPSEVVVDVKDLYDTYIADVAAGDDLIDPAMQKLNGDDFQMKFIDPENVVPDDVGVITINPLEATSDVVEMEPVELGGINLNSSLKWNIMEAR